MKKNRKTADNYGIFINEVIHLAQDLDIDRIETLGLLNIIKHIVLNGSIEAFGYKEYKDTPEVQA